MDAAPDHDAEVRTAFQRWMRTVFGAPRQPQDLITGVEARDEIIERLVTQVHRREVREERTATQERRSTRSRLHAATVDPYAYNTETLRVESQYIAQCDDCAASGMSRCPVCHGRCTVTCRNCGGSGKQASPKTGNPINCKICKKIGTVPCGACSATGAIACRTCFGSGHQLAWLTFDDSEHWQVSLAPSDSPVILAHGELATARPLARNELAAFSVVDEQRSHGAIDLRQLGEPYRQLPGAHIATVDRRLERIVSQQYLRLAVMRRDVAYEMCGTRGTVVLSGNNLAGAPTADAMRPIHRRLYAWVACVGLVAAAAISLHTSFIGSSSYFDDAKAVSGALVVASLVCAIPVFGMVLRAWQRGTRFRRIPGQTIAFAAATMLALLGIVVVGTTAQPSATDVQAALSSGAVERARVAFKAIEERGGSGLEDLDDRIKLAEAALATGADRLRLLDAVAARKGASAAEAAAAARTERLAAVRQAIAAKDTKTALASLEQWFAGDRSAEIAEERARAHEVALGRCTHDACRLGDAVRANAAHPSAARAAQVDALHGRVVESLAVGRIAATAPLVARLRQLRQLSDAAAQTLAAIEDDGLRASARVALAHADAERSRVALLRADRAVVEELLGSAGTGATAAPRIDLQGIHAYLDFDAASRCTGIYAIGSSVGNRALTSPAWPVDRLLSQAVGKPVTLRQPKRATATTQWYESGYPVTARWISGRLVELRIGAATP